jgi:cytochrome oxidase Cu insertion factor (SCO1/SenC/PrrC family)
MKISIAFTTGLCMMLPATAATAQNTVLGPKDGAGLEAVDTGRVTVGSRAPDFTLAALSGQRISLSDYRGRRNIILVFYRGYW